MLKTCDLIKDVEEKYIEMLKMVKIPEFVKCMAQFSGIAIKEIKDEAIKSLLLTWAKNKYHFYEMLGNKLYIDKPFEYTHFKEDIGREIEDISRAFPVYRPWLEGFRGQTTNKIETTYSLDYSVRRLINQSFPNFDIIGTTITHFFKANLSAPDALVTKLAAIFENQTVKATYTISIDPVDMMTASENPYDWRSCYRLEADGNNDSHADGCVAALLDKSSLITYVWNNHGKYSLYNKYELKDIRYKRMREWIAISPSLTAVHFNKIYPGKDGYEKEFKSKWRAMVEEWICAYTNKENMWKKAKDCKCVRRYGYGYDEFDEVYIYQLSECEAPERWEVFTEYVPCLCCGDPLPATHICGSEDPRYDGIVYEYDGYGFRCSEFHEEYDEEEYYCDYADEYCSHECYYEACEDCPHWQNAHPVCDLDNDIDCEDCVDVYDGIAHSCSGICSDCPCWREHHPEEATAAAEETESAPSPDQPVAVNFGHSPEEIRWITTTAHTGLGVCVDPQPLTVDMSNVHFDAEHINIYRSGNNLFEEGTLTVSSSPELGGVSRDYRYRIDVDGRFTLVDNDEHA